MQAQDEDVLIFCCEKMFTVCWLLMAVNGFLFCNTSTSVNGP